MSQSFFLHAGDARRDGVKSNVLGFIERLPDGKSWEVSIKQHVKARTDRQRRALFGPAYIACMEFMGLEGDEDKRELHRFFCREFFGSVSTPFGIRPVRTTTKNEQGQRDEIDIDTALRMYEFIQRRAADVGCFVPDPDPFWREQRRTT